MSARIEDLEPKTRELCEKFLAACAGVGIALRVTQTLRTFDEQDRLFQQGRTIPGPNATKDRPLGGIVTKAKPGQSPHNFGMAFDVCFDAKKSRACYPPTDDPRWQKIGVLGESLGLNWGGPNGKGDRFTFDRPHFERPDWKTASKEQAA